MSFRHETFEILNVLRGAKPTRYLADPAQRGIALRHDVDHSLDAALELAWREAQLGICSSYFILHDADYMDCPETPRKLRQMESFGHEIGLHTNFLAQWVRGEIDDMAAAIESTLERMRGWGLTVEGVAAHGDTDCYNKQFANYWIWRDVKPLDPVSQERWVNAEGRPVGAKGRSISYPAEAHELVREDGALFPFWSLSLAQFGLRYEASRIPVDAYFSDSGGSWATEQPTSSAIAEADRSQILLHAEHWRDEPRHVYVLSTARSGTTWLIDLLQRASTADAKHEHTLNFNPEAAASGVKNTHFVPRLQNDAEHSAFLIGAARAESEKSARDYVEANVYLAHFLHQLPHGVDTSFVHLHRDPHAVVRSLMQRDWYAVPFDEQHPVIHVPDWPEMSQFEQVCWYVRWVNETLIEHCEASLSFEKMTSDADHLVSVFAGLGIGIEPSEARDGFAQPRNATSRWQESEVLTWSEQQVDQFAAICGPICRQLGYPYRAGKLQDVPRNVAPKASCAKPPRLVGDLDQLREPGAMGLLRMRAVASPDGMGVSGGASASGVALLGGGYWRPNLIAPRAGSTVDVSSLSAELFASSGWEVVPLSIYTLGLDAHVSPSSGELRVFCLSFAESGELLEQKVVAVMAAGEVRISVHFRPHRLAKTFNLAIFKNVGDEAEFEIVEFGLAISREDRSSVKSPADTLARAEYADNAPVVVVREHTLPETVPEAWNIELSGEEARLALVLRDPLRAGQFLAFSETWHQLGESVPFGERVLVTRSDTVVGQISLDGRSQRGIAVFGLIYDRTGNQILNWRLGQFGPEQTTVAFRSTIPLDGAFAIAIHLQANTPPHEIGSVDVVITRCRSEEGREPTRHTYSQSR